jgi:flavin-dependent dehydrogenase
LGVDGAVRDLSPHPLRGMRLVAPDGTSFFGAYAGGRDSGFAVRRLHLDAALLRRTRDAGVDVREGVPVADLAWGPGGVTGVVAETAQGRRTVRARVVVGADGRRGRVARGLGLREHPSFRRFALRGYWQGMEGLGEHGEMHVAEGGYCGIAPLAPGRANVAFVIGRPEMAGAAGDRERFYRETLRRRWPALAERLQHATLEGEPAAIGPLALEASRVSVAGAVLVGDAAGFYDPFTGEGVTLALRTAELAAEEIDRALRREPAADGAGLVTRYANRRHAATHHKFRLNRLLQRVVHWPGLADAVAHRLARRPDLADELVGIAGDFIPARRALGPRFLFELLRG